MIDWNIRNHHDQEAVRASRVGDDYERTNVWRITPSSSTEHPAVFPRELAERVVRYYSFRGDVVLDPFAGIGTTGEAAAAHNRRFVLAESESRYVDIIQKRVLRWLGKDAEDVLYVGVAPIPDAGTLL